MPPFTVTWVWWIVGVLAIIALLIFILTRVDVSIK